MIRFSVFILLMITSVHASADVFFIDLNNNPNEVAAARRAAEKRKETFVVFPSQTAEQKKAYDAASKVYTAARAAYADCSGDCKKVTYDYQSAEERFLKTRPFVTDETLESKLKEMKASGAKISSLVISGHDGSGHFSGTQGSLTDTSVGQVFDKFPEIKNSIRSLHLWGCYTTTPGSIDMNWKKSFPNVSMISGYNGIAPLGDKPAGWSYLEGILTKEQEMIASGDLKKVKKMFDAIKGVNQTNSAICVGDFYVSPTQAQKLSELYQKCDSQIKELKEKAKIYQCYEDARTEECKDVPKITGSGPLREFYNLTQDSRHCNEIPQFEADLRALPKTDDIIRLIFSNQVRDNYQHQFTNQIDETNKILNDMGAPATARFKDLNKMSRTELIVKLGELKQFIEQREKLLPTNLDTPTTVDEGRLNALKKFWSISNDLAVKHTDCVPFSWVEPHASEPSGCYEADSMGNAVVDSTLKRDFERTVNARYTRYSQQNTEKMKEIFFKGEQNAATEAQLREISAQTNAYYQTSRLMSNEAELNAFKAKNSGNLDDDQKDSLKYYEKEVRRSREQKANADAVVKKESLLVREASGKITPPEKLELARTIANLYDRSVAAEVQDIAAEYKATDTSPEVQAKRLAVQNEVRLAETLKQKAALNESLAIGAQKENSAKLREVDKRVSDAAYNVATQVVNGRIQGQRNYEETYSEMLADSIHDGASAADVAQMKIVINNAREKRMELQKNRTQLIQEEAERLKVGRTESSVTDKLLSGYDD